MSNLLKSALEKERRHYSEKLYQIGVYNKEVMNKMTISEPSERIRLFLSKHYKS